MTAVHTKNYLEETGERWSANKAKAYKDTFLEFLSYCKIPSKEKGVITLGGELYPAQERVLDAIFDGLQRGIHDVKVGKGRQQGISTLCRPFSTMWAALHPGTRGALILDTAQHMEEARREVEFIISSLPAKLKFPAFKTNRYGGRFEGIGSSLTFLSAGVKRTEAGGALGRGQGLTMIHASEIGTWSNPEGVSSLRKSLAIKNPDRLFLWESTGRNVGSDWWKIWEKAVANDLEELTVFCGWYLVPTHRLEKGTPLFERFGTAPLTEDEQRKVEEVEERYGWKIDQEQIAWIRKETNPFAYGIDADEEESDELLDEYQSREHPWVEEEMFTMSGSTFFPAERLTEIVKTTVSDNYKPWQFYTGSEFLYMSIVEAKTRRETQLRVWEEPQPEGVYVVAADPAYGASENNDRSAIQVLRCYADKIEQVAEFAATMIQPFQFAWICAALVGQYSNTKLKASARFILEINGPGVAVWQEYSGLKKLLTQGYLRRDDEEGLKNFFNNAKNYLYSRPDAVVPGQGSFHHKTTHMNKIPMMERARDFVTNGVLILRSRELIEEMRTVTREGDSIEAVGTDHDDRVLSLAMGVLCWEQHERRGLINAGRTRDFEIAKHRLSVQDQFQLLSKYKLNQYFTTKEAARRQAQAEARRLQWKGRR